MSTTAPILPVDFTEGAISSFTDQQIKELVKQNVKMIVLTIPGERIMFPDFGVGIQRYLFELETSTVQADLRSRLQNQLNRYMPTIRVKNIETSLGDANRNRLGVRIEYEIDFLATRDFLDLLFEY
jgi:phage baseplate assembly protein W